MFGIESPTAQNTTKSALLDPCKTNSLSSLGFLEPLRRAKMGGRFGLCCRYFLPTYGGIQMDFDLGMLKEGLTSLGIAVGIYKQIKDSLPEGSKKEEVDEALKKAERQLKLAESQIAQGLMTKIGTALNAGMRNTHLLPRGG
jgi:hypothetical protein